MSQVLVTENYLSDIADAIRSKNSSTDTYTPAEMGNAIRSLPSGGGSSFNLIHEEDLGELNITSTSASTIKHISFSTPGDVWRDDKIIFITIRDKNGPRKGYFYGSDNMIINRLAANNSTSNYSTIYHMIYVLNTSNLWVNTSSVQTISANGYGVYAYSLANGGGDLTIHGRYSASITNAIDGDFTLKVYTLDWPEGSPFLA